MVVTASTCRTETVFDYSWKHVVCAYWNRYPNPSRWVACLQWIIRLGTLTYQLPIPPTHRSTHVLTEDTIKREVRDGKLYSRRLLSKTNPVPKWGARFYNNVPVKIVEDSVLDPVKKTFTTFTRNLGMKKIMVSAQRADFGTQGDTYLQKLNHMPPHYLCRKSMKLWFIQSKPMDVHWPCDERISARRSLDSHVPFVLLVSNALRWTATKHRMALTTCCDACSHSISWQQRRQWRRQRGRGQRQRPHRQRLQQHIMATWRWRPHKAIVVKRTHWKRQRKLATSSARRMLAK